MSVERDQPEYLEYIVTMRSRATAGVDTDNIRVFPGDVVSEVASRVAHGYGADVVEITRPDGSLYDPSKDEFERVSVAEGLCNYVVLVINTLNAAFAEAGREFEVGRIINVAAEKASSASVIGELDFSLRDANGNRVGNISHHRSEPINDIAAGSARLCIDTSSAAFDEHLGTEVARILRVVAGRVSEGEHAFTVSDLNGNAVKFELKDQPLLDDGETIDILKALQAGNVYRVDGGYGSIGDDEFCYLIPEFEVGYHQDEGDAWLVNAAGEKSPDYDQPQRVRELDFRRLTLDEKNELRNFDPANKNASADIDSSDDDQSDNGVSPS